MDSRTVVYFSQPFLATARTHLSNDDLREIADYLAAHPDAGFPSDISAQLRSLPWKPLCSASDQDGFFVWYLTHHDLPRIDVLALIVPAEDHEKATVDDAIQAIARIALISRLLHRAYRLYERVRDLIEDMPDIGA